MNKGHWDKIYEKDEIAFSWYEKIPVTSLHLINKYCEDKTVPIIDIGGGTSNLPKFLLELGYTNLTVLDISSKAISNHQSKIGNEYKKIIQWIESDVLELKKHTNDKFYIWHDRAVFHFLTQPEKILQYIITATQLVQTDGLIILSTFSTKGPEKCSGLYITQYESSKISELFNDSFELIENFNIGHYTPNQKRQDFLYTVLKKK